MEPVEPVQAAKHASLHYVSDAAPGIVRKRAGKSFSYVGARGRRVRDQATLARIKALAIPPAWTDVWICADANGHIQATGRDARKRKQYRYHARWRATRDETKYAKLGNFARALPKIRQRVRADLRLPGLPREKVLAVVVRLLETTLIRVGNEEYARANKSFGLTTLLDRHVNASGSKVELNFRGKSGKTHSIAIGDPKLAALVKRCRDVPGQHLFQYFDDKGEHQPVDSGDVNEYLHAVAGNGFTAKDFRTWGGTLLAAARIKAAPETKKAGKAALIAAVDAVAEELGNTPAICRKCYIHPGILAALSSEEGFERWNQSRRDGGKANSLRSDERRLLRFLRAQ